MTSYRFGLVILQQAEIEPADEPFVPAWDEGYTPDDTLLADIALAVEQDLNVLLVGPTGCGKTSCVLALAAILGQPVERANLHGDVRSADFLGEKVIDLDPGIRQPVVVWRDGILPRAMREGRWLLLDELDAAPASILLVLQGILEPARRLVLTANHGEVVRASPGFRFIATANTLGRGDETGLYTGTHVLNEAFLDRFIVRECDYQDAATETVLLQDRTGLPVSIGRKLVEVATLVRNGHQRAECYSTCSTRRLVAWAQVAMRLGTSDSALLTAYRLTVRSKLTGDDRSYVDGIVQRIMGLRIECR